MAKKKQTLTIETIKAQSGIEKEIKIHLDKCPTQAVRSMPLTEWVKQLCELSTKFGHPDEEVIGWVKTYASNGNWSEPQISYVLTEQGIKRYNRYPKTGFSDTEIYRPIKLVKTFRKIVVAFSRMNDNDLVDCDYSPDRIVENAENNLRQWTSRMNEGDLRLNKKLVRGLIPLLKRANELMQQKERSITKTGDMR